MRNLPTVTRTILLLNLIVWLLTAIVGRAGLNLNYLLGLQYFTSPGFHWWQFLTYMFMHANFSHLFFNMFAVLMFAPVLEREWGAAKFLFFYLVCGLGAALTQEGVWALMLSQGSLAVYDIPYLITIGASGAVFGILFAFGWLFPDVPMFLFFIPIPIRARVMVISYAAIELALGLNGLSGGGDGVAHFAHLGGFLFGWLVMLYWKYGEKYVKAWWSRIRGHKDDDNKNDHWSEYHYQRSL